MSTLRAEIVPVKLEPHPNADSLSLVKVFDYVVAVRTADWQDKDRGVYIPVDAIVDTTRPEFSFLAEPEREMGTARVKAKKLRGVFSQGLLVPVPPDYTDDYFKLGKYQPPIRVTTGGVIVAPPPVAVEYTDIENIQRYPNIFQPGEQIVVTEKIHGANARFTYQDGKFYVGSHHQWVAEDERSIWWRALNQDQMLKDMVQSISPMIVFGEVYGKVQDLRYGMPEEVGFRTFDIYDPARGGYLDYEEMTDRLVVNWLAWAPEIDTIEWTGLEALRYYAEQDSTASRNKGDMREGIVVRPLKERWDPTIGRVILKLHSQRYLLRKE